MRQIFKYSLGEGVIIKGHIEEFLHVEYQGYEPMVWAIVNDELPEISYLIELAGTGWRLSNHQNKSTYLGTVLDGIYVWHYFARLIETADITDNRDTLYKAMEKDADNDKLYNNEFPELKYNEDGLNL